MWKLYHWYWEEQCQNIKANKKITKRKKYVIIDFNVYILNLV